MAKVSKEAAEAAELLFELQMAQKRRYHAAAKANGLSPQQMATLLNLEPDHGMPMSAIAELLMCDASNVTGIVDKLEARDLAKRDQGEDRRVKVLTLTPQGERMRAAIRARMLSPPRWLLELSREDQRAFRDLLRRATEALRSAGDDDPEA
jgi:DNA-binding MarR family transcriptional regulator